MSSPGLLTFCLKSNGIPRNLCGRIQAGERATRVTEVASFDAKMKQSLALEEELELVGDSSTRRELYAYFMTQNCRAKIMFHHLHISL